MLKNRSNLIKEFKEARMALWIAINQFPPEKRGEALWGEWSLKDIVAHINGWDCYTVTLIKNFKIGVETEWGLGVKKYNEQEVDRRKDWSWNKIYAEFVELGKQIEEEYSSLSDELFDKRLWKNKDHTPRKFIKIDIDHYLQEHLPEIQHVLSSLS